MASNQPAGAQWLKKYFNLQHYNLTHSSFIGNNSSIELTSSGNIEETYGPKYAPAEATAMHHLEFSLKYDDLNLDFLQAVFRNISGKEVEEYIEKSPSGKYTRRIGFLYEFLTLKQLHIKRDISGNYINLLDSDRYVTTQGIKVPRWRINNNMLGGLEFCPIVRRKKELSDLLALDIKDKINRLKTRYSPEIFRRATQYLYKKETKSSFEIEKEQPSEARIGRFIRLLEEAGSAPPDKMISGARMIQLQNAIVDPRFAATGYRDFQNFVGQTLPNYQQYIHYICPPPAYVLSLMTGLQQTAAVTSGIDPVIRAALISFAFVFIYPFEDGNGRIHRFLIHDTLAQDELVPENMIIPISAHMLNHMKEYDTILEKYSKPLMQRITYTQKDNEGITVTNQEMVEGYYRYPDLTEQVIYLLKTVHATLDEDMPQELLFLQRYDEARLELQRIVDMPDKDINWMLIFLHQNNGVFPKRRREQFSKLSDAEIARMQAAYRTIFELDNK